MKKVLFAASALACALTGFVAVACGDDAEEVKYTFDTGCEVTVPDGTAVKGEVYELPTPPSRGKEWEFAGWYLSEDFSGAPVTSVIADLGTTYYAKWDRLYKINLELGGGTLAGSDDLYLKANENVSAYLTEYIPQREGYQFGQWLNGSSALRPNDRMPAGELTLTARYKVAYKLDVYTQNLARLLGDDTAPEFDKKEETLYEYATSKFEVKYSLQGFGDLVHDDEELEGKIVENPVEGDAENDNRFSIYFKRNQYVVTLNPNIAGTSQQEISKTMYFGQEYKLPYDAYMNIGYIFAGWSESAFGGNDYPIDYIDAILYNKNKDDQSEVEYKNPYFVKETATLYAYWNKGYTDLHGSADTIFIAEGNKEDVYLLRGGMYFKGAFLNDKEFIFNENPDDLNWEGSFIGKILSEDKFCYSDGTLEGRTYTLYSNAGGLNGDVTLRFLAFNELSYTEGTGADAKTAKGTYGYDADAGEYTASFTTGEGELVGKTVKFKLRSLYDNRGNTYAGFTIRNDEEYELGTIHRLGLRDATSIGMFQNGYFDLTLDGYGTGVFNYGATPTRISYTYDKKKETYSITLSSSTKLSLKLVSEGGFSGYMFYDEALDTANLEGDVKAFELPDGGRLTLDGMLHARYEDGASRIASGYYMLTTSYFSGYILTFTSGGTKYTFLLRQYGGILGIPVTYEAETKPNGYIEYRYYGGTSQYGDLFLAPMLVFNDEKEGFANLYERDGSMRVSATGTYELDEKSGLYIFRFTEKTPDFDHSSSAFDITDLEAFVFATDDSATSGRIYYNYSLTDNPENRDGVTVYAPDPDYKDYENQKNTTLSVMEKIAVYDLGNNEGSVVGAIQTVERNGVQITVISTENGYLYVEINEEKKTFFRYESLLGDAYLYKEDGTWEQYTTISFDGKGGATYTIPNPDSTGDDDKTIVYTGTIVSDEDNIFTFTGANPAGEQKTFRFVLLSDSNRNYFSIVSDKEGTFNDENTASGATLELDGTGFNLVYTDNNGNKYSGQYRARTENIVYTYINGEYLFFELTLTGDKVGTFRLLGSEYGTYIVMDNQYAGGTVFEFDGKGGVKVSEMTEKEGDDGETESELTPVATGTYTVKDGLLTVNYVLNDTPVVIKGRLGVVTMGNYRYSTFFKQYDSAAYTYVNEADYSVLMLDDAGNAIRFLQTGRVESGSYTLITDKTQGSDYNILYYVNSAGTYATIYKYDTETRLISAVKNTGTAYFREDFASLRFTAYGFAIFNGTDRYYYYDEGNNVAIYRVKTDKVGGTPNGYGFVKQDIGAFGATITWEEQTYHKNDGFDLVFARNADNAAKYPVTFEEGGTVYKLANLQFSPTGSMAFSVAGTATLSYTDEESRPRTEDRDCTVIRRALTGEGQTGYETFVMVGNFRFDLELTYRAYPEKCAYEVSAMSLYLDAGSYTYYYNIEKFYPQYGSQVFDMLPDFGHVVISRPYNENGEPGDYTASGELGVHYRSTGEETKRGFLDANGNAIESFTDLPCLVETQNDQTTYTVTLDYTDTAHGGDGYIYKAVYTIDTERFGMPAFFLLGFYREQKITKGDYSVTVGRIIISDNVQQYAPGTIIVPEFTDNGEVVTGSAIFGATENLNFVVRTVDETTKKVTASVYYKICLVEKGDSGALNGDEVLPYDADATTITKIANVKPVYTASGSDFVEIDEDTNSVLCYNRGGRNYAVTESTYDEAAKTYVITTSSAKYIVTITVNEDGTKTATIENYVEPDAE